MALSSLLGVGSCHASNNPRPEGVRDVVSACDDKHNLGFEHVNATIGSREHHRTNHTRSGNHIRSPESPFFIRWLDKPNLKIDILLNDPDHPQKNVERERRETDPKIGDIFFSASGADSDTEHISQFYTLLWQDKEEPYEARLDSRLRLKFGVLKVTNLHRDLKRGRIYSGIAHNLYAEMRMLDPSGLSMQERMSWFHPHWDNALTGDEVDDDSLQKRISMWKVVVKNTILLRNKYLKHQVIDTLQIGDSAYLWLFFTSDNDNQAWTPSNSGPRIAYDAGPTFRLSVCLSGDEGILKRDLAYDVKFTDWSHFTITPIKKEALSA